MKPCPFCGSTNLKVEEYDQDAEGCYVRCLNCAAAGPESYYQAVTVWNNRV